MLVATSGRESVSLPDTRPVDGFPYLQSQTKNVSLPLITATYVTRLPAWA